MRILSDDELLAWALGKEMFPKEGYAQWIQFRSEYDASLARFWDTPVDPDIRIYFIATLIEALGEWTACYVWRPLGWWPIADDDQTDLTENFILGGLGVPLGTYAVVAFSPPDSAKLAALIFAATVYAGNVHEDLVVVPDHARHWLKVSHHDTIHVDFRTKDDLDRMVAFMADRGFPLPGKLPDATFKTPPWMK